MLKETKSAGINIWCSEVDVVVRVCYPCGRDLLLGLYDIDVKQVCECGIQFIVDCRITVRTL